MSIQCSDFYIYSLYNWDDHTVFINQKVMSAMVLNTNDRSNNKTYFSTMSVDDDKDLIKTMHSIGSNVPNQIR